MKIGSFLVLRETLRRNYTQARQLHSGRRTVLDMRVTIGSATFMFWRHGFGKGGLSFIFS